jgi:Arc/MetJ-type ribon-helix-helix transcriptional regulator
MCVLVAKNLVWSSIEGMKVSVSLPEADIEFLDEYVHRRGTPSRSAVLHRAIDLLRRNELEDLYAEAWAEADGGETWDVTSADGLSPASPSPDGLVDAAR